MRNTLIGAVLAIILVAGLFAAARFGSRPAQGPEQAQQISASQVAAQVKPGFIGETKLGEWALICGPAKELPKAPGNDGHPAGNSAGQAIHEAPPPPGWTIPRCRVALGLRSAHNPQEQVRLTFRQVGFKRVLALFLRFPPTEVQNGDVVTIKLDGADWPIPIRSCAAQFCLAIQSIKFADIPVLETSKHLTLSFTPAMTQKLVQIMVPMTGLKEGLDTMRRIDK